MVEQKLIHYNDDIIIECIDNENARVILKDTYLNSMYNKNMVQSIIDRLKKDFNFTNDSVFSWEVISVSEKGINLKIQKKQYMLYKVLGYQK